MITNKQASPALSENKGQKIPSLYQRVTIHHYTYKNQCSILQLYKSQSTGTLETKLQKYLLLRTFVYVSSPGRLNYQHSRVGAILDPLFRHYSLF